MSGAIWKLHTPLKERGSFYGILMGHERILGWEHKILGPRIEK